MEWWLGLARSMPMPMVRIGHMRVGMGDGLVLVPMAVRTAYKGRKLGVMLMVMVPIVMAVRMFMGQRFVRVRMRMGLHQVQDHP